MILAAGLGTRLGALGRLCPKPALPIRGVPLVAHHLAWLAANGVSEVVLNLHHEPERVREAALRCAPEGLAVHFSHEPALLDTGGGLRQAAAFLRESDPSLFLAGDMLFDFELAPLLARHRERRDAATLVLRDDPRAERFGTIGIDDAGRVRRIGRRFDLGGETRAGVYISVTLIAAAALDSLPERRVFGHLDDWLAPQLRAGADDVRGELLASDRCDWEPVGTPDEYLAANFSPLRSRNRSAEAAARRAGVRVEPELIVGAGAELGAGARLERVVVWDGERVPPGFEARDGVFAGGRFHACAPEAAA
ncbi:MAG: sugar phosphate nucleotidyltransferase [Myxococcota bacterium]|nr:sugar phosphate nucleotidyltransferase [Myxococcota bacterium]